jgi:hypothetical protein
MPGAWRALVAGPDAGEQFGRVVDVQRARVRRRELLHLADVVHASLASAVLPVAVAVDLVLRLVHARLIEVWQHRADHNAVAVEGFVQGQLPAGNCKIAIRTLTGKGTSTTQDSFCLPGNYRSRRTARLGIALLFRGYQSGSKAALTPCLGQWHCTGSTGRAEAPIAGGCSQ